MKKLYFIFVLLLTAYNAFTQNFINGSFETTTDSCKTNIPHNNVHNVIPGVYSFGTSQGIDFRANSCPFLPSTQPASARHGSKFLVFGYDGTGGDSFAMALTSPLIAGQTYRVHYSQRRESSSTSPIYEIGYSNDSNKFGTLISQGHCVKGLSDNIYAWQDTFYQFTPTINARFITFKSILDGEFLYIDNFSINFPNKINDVELKQVNCYPNPFNDYTIIQTSNIVFPYNAQLSDIMGKVHYSKANIDKNEFKIHKANLPNGLYFLKLYDSNMNIYCTRLTITE